MKKMLFVLSVILVATMALTACGPKETGPVTINLWTKEGEADGGFQYVTALTDAYTAAHPNVTFVVTNKEVETLREDFQTASLAGSAPELLWTVSDHLGPFTTADLIQPVDKLVDLSQVRWQRHERSQDPRWSDLGRSHRQWQPPDADLQQILDARCSCQH